DTPFLKAWSIEDQTFRDFGKPGAVVKEISERWICTELDGDLEFYDPETFEPLPGDALRKELTVMEVIAEDGKRLPVKKLSDGRLAGVRGQEYFIVDRVSDVPQYIRIPTDPPATQIHTLTTDEQGNVWGSSAFGQTIFRYNPKDGTVWNSPAVCNAGGEVYGMCFVQGRLFMSAYVGG
ncbi:hypothetical protein U6Q21_12610, partial [Cutibacterium acnes]